MKHTGFDTYDLDNANAERWRSMPNAATNKGLSYSNFIIQL